MERLRSQLGTVLPRQTHIPKEGQAPVLFPSGREGDKKRAVHTKGRGYGAIELMKVSGCGIEAYYAAENLSHSTVLRVDS